MLLNLIHCIKVKLFAIWHIIKGYPIVYGYEVKFMQLSNTHNFAISSCQFDTRYWADGSKRAGSFIESNFDSAIMVIN